MSATRRHYKSFLLGVLIAFGLPALAFTSYNYFAPGGALSCTAPCTAQNVDLTQAGNVSGPLRVGAGGIGVNTLTGIAKGNGTGAFTAATASDITTLAAANPSGLIGLTATNGVATTLDRSDSTHALSQAITPTWTGLHLFTAGAGATPSLEFGNTGNQGILFGGNSSTFNANPTSGDNPHTFEIVNDNGTLQGIRLASYGTVNASLPIHFFRANGTLASPTALNSGQNIMSFGARGWDGTSTGSAIAIEGETAEAWSSGHNGSLLGLEVTPVGSAYTSRFRYFQLSAQNTIMRTTGNPDATKSGIQIAGRSGLPGLYVVNQNNSADQRLVELLEGSNFAMGFNTDNNSSSKQFFGAVRGTANAVTSVTLGNATDSTAVLLPGLASTSAAQTGSVCWSSTGGNLTVDTTTTCLASTRRVKHNIRPLESGLAEVMQLRPVSYELKPEFDPGHLGRQVGLISEEVGPIDDRLISHEKDGSPLGVRYQQLTAVLIRAIQEQQHEIDQLKRRLSTHAPK